jgi:hypothetical protein
MNHYAWTIKYRGHEDIRHVTTLAGLFDVLRALELPGLAPPAFVVSDGEIPDHGHYTHNEGGSDEWSLTWTRIDDTPIAD